MKILNLGSLNLDHFYELEDFVRPGETISARHMRTALGGKGYNQSLALARAGAGVCHAGQVGAAGDALVKSLQQAGVDTGLIRQAGAPTGHAVIQVNSRGQNCIIVFGGANHSVDAAYVDEVLAGFSHGDILLVQNETTMVPYAMEAARGKGMQVVFNPSPVGSAVLEYPLDKVNLFILNEHEAALLCGQSEADGYTALLDGLQQRFPAARFVLTAGREGAYYRDSIKTVHHSIYDVPVADTTGAGDTFCGYFLACSMRGMDVAGALKCASLASSYSVGIKGAGPSVPTWQQLEDFAARLGEAVG